MKRKKTVSLELETMGNWLIADRLPTNFF